MPRYRVKIAVPFSFDIDADNDEIAETEAYQRFNSEFVTLGQLVEAVTTQIVEIDEKGVEKE